MTKYLCVAALAALLCASSLSSASAEDAFYLGNYKITQVMKAPWAKSDAELVPEEMKSLVGQTITIESNGIAGPGSFPCSDAVYQVMEGGPDMLFQGMFGQMHDEKASNDPQKLAEQVGFSGTQYWTVLTGCEYAVDFSFGTDKSIAMFALNNAVYTMKRQ